MCKRSKTANFRGNGRSSNRSGMRRINIIGQATDQSDESPEWDWANAVFQLNRTGVPQFLLKVRINKQQFSVKIDSGSPITTFTLYERKREKIIEKWSDICWIITKKREVCRLQKKAAEFFGIFQRICPSGEENDLRGTDGNCTRRKEVTRG